MNDDTTPLDTTPIEGPAEPPRRPRSLRPLALGIVGGVAAAALASGGIALASTVGSLPDDRLVINSSASPSDDDDLSASPNPTSSNAPISAEDRAAIEAAALAAVGGGTVVEVSRGDDPGEAYRVTVRLANGDLAEVRLAADLSVLRVKLDNSGSDDVGDDNGGSGSGSDDGTSHDVGDDHGGSGSDDSGSDDSGSGGHGSDDSGSDDSGSAGHGSDD